MKSNTIISGIWLIFIGLIVLLHNFDIIAFNFWAIIKLTPLLIIALGINLIVQNKSYGRYVSVGVNVVICAILFIVGIATPKTTFSSNDFFSKSITINDNNDDFENLVSHVEAPYENDENVHLIFNGGGGNYKLENKSITNLFEASTANNSMGMELNTTQDENGKTLEINSKGVSDSKNKNNALLFTLHPNPIWDLEFNVGAANFNCDLSQYKIKNLAINSGATSMNLTLGAPQNGITKIEIATAASSINLRIPKDAACSFTQESILSSKKIAGFDIKDGDVMKTTNFDTATNKYEIELNGAANSFTVTRY